MRKLLNTLHVMTQGAYLHCDGETVVVKVGPKLKLRIPVYTLEGLVCWGQVSCSPPVLGLCCEHGLGISFVSEQGRLIARVQGRVNGNVLLRQQQYRIADNEALSLPLVRSIVTTKIANSRTVLLRAARECGVPAREERLREIADRLSRTGIDAKRSAGSIEEARGYEDGTAQAYFSVFGEMITGDRETFHFGGCSRRPALDRVNAVLSFVYALLRHDIESALESTSLDPAVGFLHTDRPGRPSLALDIMEELHSSLTDRAEGFTQQDGGAFFSKQQHEKRCCCLANAKARRSETSIPERENPARSDSVYTGALVSTSYTRWSGRLSCLSVEIANDASVGQLRCEYEG